MTVALPTEKSAPTLRPETAKVLLYGPPKIGKSTLASEVDPDKTLFLACEPGLGGLEVFKMDITSWTDFREAGALLATERERFQTVVVDTVDELYRMCAESECAKLGIDHPADAEYGKGWAAVGDEFRLRVGKLAGLGLGVWFISHAKDIEIDKRVGKITKTVPTLKGQGRDFLIGFCDVLLLADTIEVDGEEERVLRTRATENYEAGARGKIDTQLSDPLPLDAKALRADMKRAWTPAAPKPTTRGTSRKAEPVAA